MVENHTLARSYFAKQEGVAGTGEKLYGVFISVYGQGLPSWGKWKLQVINFGKF